MEMVKDFHFVKYGKMWADKTNSKLQTMKKIVAPSSVNFNDLVNNRKDLKQP